MKKLLAYLIFSVPLYNALGAQLPQDAKIEVLDDWSGGLNTSEAPHKLKKNESPNLRNFYVDEADGSLVQSNGYVLSGTASQLSKITGMFPFEKSDGTKMMLVTDSSQVLATSDFNTFSTVKTVLTTSVLLNCFQVRDKMWCSNGADSVFTYDGSTTVVLDGSNYGGTLQKVPNVPKFKYGKFFQSRVFGANDSNDRSGLYFSALTDTNAVILAPDAELAWPAANALRVGQGDGQTLGGLFVKDGLLYAGKTRSLYGIFGTDEFTYSPKLIDTEVGIASHDSLAEGDGLEYWLGQDGVYKFTGTQAQRISDNIRSNMDMVNKSDVNQLSNVWDTQSQFSKGAFAGTTGTAAGFVVIPSSTDINQANAVSPVATSSIGFNGDGFTQWAAFTTTMTVAANTNWRVSKVTLWCRQITDIYTIAIKVRNLNSPSTIENFTKTEAFSIDFAKIDYTFPKLSSSVYFTSQEVLGSSISIQISTGSPANPLAHFDFFPATTTSFATITLEARTTGQFISEVTTLTTVGSWGAFDAVSNTNGGSINFYIRGSTWVTINSTENWTSISPGAVIGLPTAKRFIQWASTLTAVNSTPSVTLDNVTISHVEGQGAQNRAVAINWLSRYWLAVSTESSGNLSLIYAKARITNSVPDAWTVFEGINIRSMAVLNGTLYGGSATSGQIYRLDYGTNYNGTAINAYYDTPDLPLNDLFLQKNLSRYYLDFDKFTGATLSIGTSVDGGSFGTNSLSIDGSGRALRRIDNIPSPRFGSTVRIRIQNSGLDKSLTFHSLGVVYKPVQVEPGE